MFLTMLLISLRVAQELFSGALTSGFHFLLKDIWRLVDGLHANNLTSASLVMGDPIFYYVAL